MLSSQIFGTCKVAFLKLSGDAASLPQDSELQFPYSMKSQALIQLGIPTSYD